MKIPEKIFPIIILTLIFLVIGLTLLWWQAKETVNRQFEVMNKISGNENSEKTKGLKLKPEEEWVSYHNDKYNYSINIPSIYGPDLLKGAMYSLNDALENAKSSDTLSLFDWTDCGGDTSFKITATENRQELLCNNLSKEKNCQIESERALIIEPENQTEPETKRYSCETKTLNENDFYTYSKKEGVCFEKDGKFYEISLNIAEREVSEDMFGIFDASSNLFKKTLAGFQLN